jgi:hypothetical protein
MATDRCKGFLGRLDSWISGERPAEAKAHFHDCTSCQAVVEDLNAIQIEARSWKELESEAPERIWIALRAQLEQEGLICAEQQPEREAAPVASSPADWLGAVFARIPRPALAGAYLSILVALGFALSGPVNQPSNEAKWLEGTRVVSSPISAQLDNFELNTSLANRDRNPAITASLHQNLAIVDKYISLCEKSVQEEPENEVARDYLYSAYKQKADLLAQIGERGENVQ